MMSNRFIIVLRLHLPCIRDVNLQDVPHDGIEARSAECEDEARSKGNRDGFLQNVMSVVLLLSNWPTNRQLFSCTVELKSDGNDKAGPPMHKLLDGQFKRLANDFALIIVA